MSNTRRELPIWLLFAMCWLLAAYFLVGFVKDAGFPPKPTLEANSIVMLVFGLLFLFVPFFNRLRLGGLIELERDMKSAQSEIREFKAEVRNMMAIVNTSINTASNISSVTVPLIIPGIADLEDAKEGMKVRIQGIPTEKIKNVREGLELGEEDSIMALARTRIRLEYILRRIVGKQTDLLLPNDQDTTYMGLPGLYRRAMKLHPKLEHVKLQFEYVRQVSNAAIHAQRISAQQASDALDLGAMLIAFLEPLSKSNEQGTQP